MSNVPAKKMAMVEFYRGKLNEAGWNVPAVVFDTEFDTEEDVDACIRDLKKWYKYATLTPAEKQAIRESYRAAGFVLEGGAYAA